MATNVKMLTRLDFDLTWLKIELRLVWGQNGLCNWKGQVWAATWALITWVLQQRQRSLGMFVSFVPFIQGVNEWTKDFCCKITFGNKRDERNLIHCNIYTFLDTFLLDTFLSIYPRKSKLTDSGILADNFVLPQHSLLSVYERMSEGVYKFFDTNTDENEI